MVKNIPTIERSTKIRFGKHATDDQAENTIVINASDSAINAINEGSIYMAPLRVAELAGSNLVGYSSITKELVDSSVPTSLLGGVTLDSATVQGNIVSNAIPHFANTLTAFTTGHGSNVGISNTAPTHMLSVGDSIFMSNTGAEAIKVEGNVRANRFFSGSSVLIDGNSTNKIQVSGTIKTGVLRVDNIGISNNSPTHALSLGNEGQLRLNVPTESIYALETVGNVSAQNYIGDGGLLSNVTLQTVTDKSNVTSNTIHLTNPTTSLKAYSNVIVDGTLDVGSNLYVNDTAADVLNVTGNVNVSNYLKTNKLEVTSLEVDAVTAGTVSSNIVGNNVNVITVTANVVADNVVATNISSVTLNSNVIADNVVATNISSVTLNSNVIADNVSATTITGDGSAITQLDPANLSSQVLLAKGGTGLTSIAQNELLLGPASGTALDTLPPYNADATKKFLRSSAAGIAWDDVSSTLQAITTGGATTSDEVSFTNGVTSLTASGNVVATGNVTASTFKSTTLTSGKIPYVNNDHELIDGPIGHDSTTNNTFVSSNLYVTGNLTVQGTTTFQDSNIHTVSDPIIEIGNANAIDTIDMGVIMTRPTANVVSGYMGDEKKYVIAYTLSDPDGAHIVPTNATSDQFMTLSVEGGNVLAGNVITTGLVEAATLQGDGSAITSLNPANLSSQVLIAKGGTGLTSVAQNELLLGPASGTALAKLSAYTGPAAVTVPPSGMSSTTQTIGGIQYTSSASTTGSGTATNNAFDHDNTTIWRSSVEAGESYASMDGYYGGSNTTGSYSGAWIQLYRATAIAPTSIQIIASQTTSIPAPNGWKVFGSTNGSSWTEIHSSSTAVTWNSGNGHTATISGSAAYNYLRLAVQYSTMASSMGTIAVSEVRFSAQGTGPTEKFLRSSAAGIVWDEVSSTLQTITDGGATTTQTVAFNNTTTGLTSAGDIDIAATKQIDYAGDVLLKSSAGTVASLKVNNAIKLDPASGALIVPPSGMSSTTQTIGGIQYTSSASTTRSGTATNNAFDHDNTTIWRSNNEPGEYYTGSGNYNGSNTTGSYSGAWIQLYRATAIAPTSIQIIPAQTTFAAPSGWKVFGSTNGSSWTEIHSSSTAVTWNSGNGHTATISGSAAYNYLRLAVQQSTIASSVGTIAVSEVRFTGPPPPSNNVLSFNTTTGEIYDSGGQGGSSLDNIIEEGSNVAIGPSAASANLTVNTYGSNVLTVTGNVSADNITIGALNVAASPFALDDVVSVNAGANVTANVLTLGGLVTSGNVDASNIIVSGNTTSQNITLTNTDISATISSGTITIDAREKSYGTAPLVVSTTDVSNLVFSNLITGAQIVVPILASGGDVKISKELTNVNFYAMTTDVSITQDKHALMTLSNLYGNIYMNAIGFA